MTETDSWDSRTRRLIGDEGARRLQQSRVFVAGLGGVGGYVAEMLARSGVGCLILVDADCVSLSNINRQLIADTATVGIPKTDLWTKRLTAINPDIEIIARREFITPDNVAGLLDIGCDYVVDAIDTIAPKCALLRHTLERGIPLVSSMGAGGRLDPTRVRYGTLADTRGDGLARTLRQRLRKMQIDVRRIPVVWSEEEPVRGSVIDLEERNKRSSFGTLASIPALFGIYMANYLIRDISAV